MSNRNIGGIISAGATTGIQTRPTTVEYLVVAGGGGGGGFAGGGGGAGGLLTGTSYPVTTGSTITITIGAGGTCATGYSSGDNGSNTTFGSIKTLGGGGGATNAGSPGGSGGGSGRSANSPAGVAGTVGQGFPSGVKTADDCTGAGGGGAGGPGRPNVSGISGGHGGPGVASSITGSLVMYAGGGGGGIRVDGTQGSPQTGGLGTAGGGNAARYGDNTLNSGMKFWAQSGIVNTGGGGGGGTDPLFTGGVGGSGIVVLRYPSYLASALATTGSPTTYVTGQWRVYIFVASGTITF